MQLNGLNELLLATLGITGLVLLHLWHVPLAAGMSLAKFWNSDSPILKISKVLFVLSLLSCFLIFYSDIIALVVVFIFFCAHLILANRLVQKLWPRR